MLRTATAIAVAFVVFSCKDKMAQVNEDYSSAPQQMLEDMFAIQTKNGNLVMRLEAGKMERYDNDTASLDIFPEGFAIYSYTDDGVLESLVIADNARHITTKNNRNEVWEAYGNVVMHNVIKQETMETDTIYWDRTVNLIYTDCYVKMYSEDGFMQGYGMESDDKVRNAILKNPFNTYGVTSRDTTVVIVDSVNFIGPFLKK